MLHILKNSSFTTRLFISLVLFLFIILGLFGFYINNQMENQLYTQLGARAQIQAKEIAIIPHLVSAIQNHNISDINELVSEIYQQSDASYIVIGDNKGNHLFHTTKGIVFNSPMVGGDNDAVLHGESIISIRHGSLGMSLRGKAPILNSDNEVIGIVSVGYFQDKIKQMHIEQFGPVSIMLFFLLVALFIFSWIFTKSIKSQMFDLEPKQISHLVQQQEAILESIFEGVIAIDTEYRITAINHAARVMLRTTNKSQNILTHDLKEIITTTDFFYETDNKMVDKHDEVCYFNDMIVIANRVRVIINGVLQGWVITFRDKNDINILSAQLSQVRRFSDNLRVMRHEHLNWLAMLSGLLRMKLYDEAISLLEATSAGDQETLDFISERFKNPSICGLLLGKYSRAKELGLELMLDPLCKLSALPKTLSETDLMSIIGNLIDNAFDAVIKLKPEERTTERDQIELYISDESDELVIEVADYGCGIEQSVHEHIFKRGVTTHTEGDHGIGLYLVNLYVEQAHGMITTSNNSDYGTIFSIFIPK